MTNPIVAPVAELLKNPAVGNTTSGGLLAVMLVLFLNPDLTPFAHAEHEHDIKNVQVEIETHLEKAALNSEIKAAARAIDDYTTQIELELCLQDGCAFEKAQQKRTENRRKLLAEELDRLK